MKIIVYFEPKHIFNKKLKDTVSYNQLMRYCDNNKILEEIKNIAADKEVCTVTLEDLSGFNSHVLESFNYFVHLLDDYTNIKVIKINNPARLLLDMIKKMDNIYIESKYEFPMITEQKVIDIKNKIDNHIIGQGEAKNRIVRKLFTLSIRPNNKPFVIMFYGNPGLGKTETAKFLAKELYNGELLREQMSMSGGENSVKYFKSTTHNENSFSKRLVNRTSNIILLDEFTLAPDYIKSSFFQMFDEGIFADQNFEVDVSKSIIICTTNILTIRDMYRQLDSAILSRFDAFIEYKDFTEMEKQKICRKVIAEYLNSNKIKQKYDKILDEDYVYKFISTKLSNLHNMREIKTQVEDIISGIILDRIMKEY